MQVNFTTSARPRNGLWRGPRVRKQGQRCVPVGDRHPSCTRGEIVGTWVTKTQLLVDSYVTKIKGTLDPYKAGTGVTKGVDSIYMSLNQMRLGERATILRFVRMYQKNS
jgi:hypothetical protein